MGLFVSMIIVSRDLFYKKGFNIKEGLLPIGIENNLPIYINLETNTLKPLSDLINPAINAGIENITDANITGITPAEFNLNGI